MEAPNLYTIERNPGNEEGHAERRLERIDKKNIDPHEAMKEAQDFLLGNEKLYQKFVRGFVSKAGNHPVELAGLENIFVMYCQDLSEAEIESLVRQFNRGLADYVIKNKVNLEISQVQYDKLLSSINTQGILARGIVSIVKFIRERRILLDSAPEQEYSFYVEENLDARHKIDLVECIYKRTGEEILIDTVNLIQVKSSEPNENQENAILSDHEMWISSCVMDFDTFEREFSNGVPEGMTVEAITKNSQELEEILLDICTDPAGFNPDNFVARLNLEDLSSRQKAWLLFSFGKDLRQKIENAVEQGILAENEARSIIESLDRLENKVRAKAKMPRQISTVPNINSIIAVGSRIIKQVAISKEENKKKRKVFKIA